MANEVKKALTNVTLYTLAQEYNVHITTFKRWIEPFKHRLSYREEKRRILTPKEVRIIKEVLGEP